MSEDTNDQTVIESAAPAPEATESSAAPAVESGEESKETLLEVVQKVLEPKDKSEESSTRTEESPASEDESDEDKEQAEDGKNEADAASEEEEPPPDVTPKARKQINKLLKDRRELRHEVETLRPTSEIGRELQHFTQAHDLSGEDVINALHIAAVLRRGDYKSFYEMVSPYVRTAQEYLGVVLPEDLQSMVQQQQMTENAAREFARVRFDQQRAQIENTRMNEAGQAYFAQQARSTVATSVSDYENRLAANDPDYAQKAGFVQRAASAMLRERGGQISSPQEAIDIVRAAYDEVNSHFRKLERSKQRPTPPQPGGTNSQPSVTRAQPRSMREAMENALKFTRTG